MKKLFLVGFLMILLAVVLLPQDTIEIPNLFEVKISHSTGMIHWQWLLAAGILFLISFTIMFIFYHIRNKQVTGLGNSIDYMRTLIEKKDETIREKKGFIEYQEVIISELEEMIKEKNKALKTAQKTLEKIQKEKKKNLKDKYSDLTADEVKEQLPDEEWNKLIKKLTTEDSFDMLSEIDDDEIREYIEIKDRR